MKLMNMVLNGSILAGLTAGLLSGCTTGGEAGRGAGSLRGEAAVDYAKPGFHTEVDAKDGRLWVFKLGSDDLAKFKADGRPARHVLRPGAGPGGVTLKSTESETIIEYLVAKPGFHTELDKDGRLWVFTLGSPELAEFKAKGTPARHVVRPGAGPLGLTLKATDAVVLDAYLK